MPAIPSSSVERRPDCGGPASIRKKTYYPPTALRKGLEGRVSVQFVIDKEREVQCPRIADGSNEVLNRAALRAIRRLECTPGEQRSRPVRVKMTMPVVFALPGRLEPHRMEP
ncbi:energy transducer TonB [Salinibacter altiplanensis]|uniref:energy transducer TonB n=1 Tax=Salinibacter altiplanensis TaxID=1803181 RepID=UPI003C6E52C5